jgi:hypothetical protein
MVATMHAELTVRIRIGPCLDVLDVGSVDANRNVVFGFTGNCAGMTADAGAVVDDETVVDHEGGHLTSRA